MSTLLFVIGLLLTAFAGVAVYGAVTEGYDDPGLEAARFVGKVAAFFYLAAIAATCIGC